MDVVVIETAQLGDRSYVVHDGTVAVVVDPQRDLDRLEAALAEAGVRVSHVVETHLHNDYVTGGLALARRTGATYVVAAGDDVAYDRLAVRDGAVFRAGELEVEVVATPGHTDHHVAYLVRHRHGDHEQTAVFSGGSLLYGSVGRTDLVDGARTEELTRAQYRSARRLAALVPDDSAPLYPTHGFGSFCSSGAATGAASSTVGEQRAGNDALTDGDEAAFVERLMAGLTAYPRYYAHMGALNRSGPDAADLTPPEPVDAETLGKRLAAGEWVVDLRDRTAYAAGHLRGSVSIELGRQFTTYFGWVVPWAAPVTLIADTAEHIAEARRNLSRIGVDALAGAAVGDIEGLAGDEPTASYACQRWEDLRRALHLAERSARPSGETEGQPVVLDVRRDDEWAAGHLHGAVHVPLHDLTDRLAELPDTQLWVHCGGGFRAGIAASLLERSGRQVICIDDEWFRAAPAGLPVISE